MRHREERQRSLRGGEKQKKHPDKKVEDKSDIPWSLPQVEQVQMEVQSVDRILQCPTVGRTAWELGGEPSDLCRAGAAWRWRGDRPRRWCGGIRDTQGVLGHGRVETAEKDGKTLVCIQKGL